MLVKKRTEIMCMTLTMLFVLVSSALAEAEWATNGDNIYNTNSGNVGIGTSDPSRQVEIQGSSKEGYLALTRSDAGTSNLMGALLYGNSVDDSLVHIRAFEDGVNDAGRLEILTEGTDGGADIRMTIKSNGNVGIGTTSPGTKLEVNGRILGTGSNSATMYLRANDEASGSKVWGIRSDQGNFYIGNATDAYIGWKEIVTVLNNGNVGIGTTNPISTLHVVTSGAPFTPDTASDDFVIGSSAATGISIQSGSINSGRIVFAIDGQIERGGIVYDHANSRMRFDTNNTANQMVIDQDGKVGIGTTDPQSKLAVNGMITAKDVKVTNTGWSDFVFDENYALASLDEVESFIGENKHLPDIPSAKEVEQQGLVVSEMLAKQMQKIEEMTLYLIELKKENNLLKATIADQDKRLASLKELRARIEALEQKN